MTKLKYVDVLRGLAILAVLMVHCSLYSSQEHFPDIIASILANGTMGVQLFFVASAFTLFLSMDKRSEIEKYPKLNFFIRRFFRIAPMYYVGICYYIWQNGFGPGYWLGDAPGISIGNVLANIFFVHGFNPYWITSIVPGGWSIAVEMMFYCLVPLLFVKIKNTQQACIFVFITLFIRMVLEVFFHRFQLISFDQLWADYLFFYLPSQLPVFALGILFYYIVKEDYRLTISPVLILLTSLALIGQFVGLPVLPDHILFGIAFLVLGIALSKSAFPFLENPVLLHIGKISYSMYVVHFAVLHWMEKLNLINYPASDSLVNFGIRFLIVIVLTVLISTLFYQFIEVPMQNVGKRLIDKLNKRKTKPNASL